MAVSQLVAPAEERRAKSTVGAAGRWCQATTQASPRLCPHAKNLGKAAHLCLSLASRQGRGAGERSCSNTDILVHVWGVLYTGWRAGVRHPRPPQDKPLRLLPGHRAWKSLPPEHRGQPPRLPPDELTPGRSKALPKSPTL